MANIAEQISEPSNIEAEIAKSIIISNFLVPELLEDEMSTQFVNQPKAKKEILNIKLGMSFANQASVSSDSILIVEIFHKNE